MNRSLNFDMGKAPRLTLDLVKVYEELHKNNKLETPFRLFLKEIFRYAEHVGILTFRNYSLDKLVDDSLDSRRHVSAGTVDSSNLDHRLY